MTGTETSRLDALRSKLYSAVISDALDNLGSSGHLIGDEVRPMSAAAEPLVGRAFTARAIAVDSPPAEPYATLLAAIDKLEHGQVLVISGTEGKTRSAIFGGLLATAAIAKGAAGCIVDGAIRDTSELERLSFPTFASMRSPADSCGRDEVIEFQGEVQFGGCLISPGDLVVADIDGVVVVPSRLERQVLDLAQAKMDSESEMRAELSEGMSIKEAFAKYEIL